MPWNKGLTFLPDMICHDSIEPKLKQGSSGRLHCPSLITFRHIFNLISDCFTTYFCTVNVVQSELYQWLNPVQRMYNGYRLIADEYSGCRLY